MCRVFERRTEEEACADLPSRALDDNRKPREWTGWLQAAGRPAEAAGEQESIRAWRARCRSLLSTTEPEPTPPRRIKPAADNPVLLRDPAFADRADCDAACDARNGDQAGHQHDLRWPRCPKRSIRRVGPALGRHLPSTLGYAFNL
jgi:hypothetical protein